MVDRESRLIKSVGRVAVMLLFGVFWYYAGYSVGFGAGIDEMRFVIHGGTHEQVDQRAQASDDPLPTLTNRDVVAFRPTADEPDR